MEILIARTCASVAEVQAAMPDPPSYSAVRATLRIMEEKGHVVHKQDGATYVYSPVTEPVRARQSALRHLIDTLFSGSTEQAVAALLDGHTTPVELDRIADMIDQARHAAKHKEVR